MGNDGGVIAVKRKFMRHANVKARGEKADQEVQRLEKARTCAMSLQPLRELVVACRLGNLFNKQTVLEHLLAKSVPERFQHITSLKDVVTCRVTYGREEEPLWCCPITMVEFNGKQPFVVLFKCGCVLSERVLKAVDTSECLVCGNPFHEQDVVTLLLEEEQYKENQKKLLEQKMEEKRVKKNKKRMKSSNEEKKDEKHEQKKAKKEKKSKRKAEQLGDSGDTKLVKIVKDAGESISRAKEKSQVFASIFSKDKKERRNANDLLMTIGGMRYTLS
ncbi:unnamed protein product [Peronospora destructor]|uniref:Replication termination factor 2 n=1 Tax=Peronospora destructor TaxID=86335 RepID=A0AAV0V7C2_9STRA|nr:unnamed protein product [Peronospora destructor]